MKVLLINPPFNRLKGLREFYYPIGLGYLAATLRKEGYDAIIYNMDAPLKEEAASKYKDSYTMQMQSHWQYLKNLKDENHHVWKELREVLLKKKPEILALTSSSAKFSSALRVAEIYKELFPEGIVILGGPHATICSEEIAQKSNIDFIVRGEGDITITELCNIFDSPLKKSSLNPRINISNDEHIKGLSYKTKKGIVHNLDRELIQDLDTLPFPERKAMIFPERYSPEHLGAIVTLRGCPFRCGFCAAKCIWTRKVRKRSVQNVISEIKYVLKEFRTKEFFFWDDSFTIDKKRTMEFCHELIKHKFHISWGCSTKVTLLDEELVRTLKKAGCGSIELGVETGSERMLKIIKKDITIDQVRKATRLLDKHHISYTLFLMVGFPEETKEDIEQTIRFVKETKHGFLCFSIFTPYPGTELYEKSNKLKLIPEKMAWEHYSHQSPENTFTSNISKEEFSYYAKSMAKLIDKHNSSYKRKLEYTRARMSFYTRNPRLFIKRAIEEVRRK